jgi:DNA-binding winged helix-turn-helix (wHTH) protein
VLSFPPFRLDLTDERLWKDGKELRLRRKPMAILRYLVQHPRRLVTQDEIVAAVWGKVAMSENLLRTYIHELRHVIGEGIIETVIGRGYRFLADVTEVEEPERGTSAGDLGSRNTLVGRSAELGLLRSAYRTASTGRRQLVFIAGEAGIGKTTLMDALASHAAGAGAWTARGASVEQYGSGEAYLPVMQAMVGLCRGRSGNRVVDVLSRNAPTWLVQMPSLVPVGRLEEFQRLVSTASQPRMLREIAEALEVLSAERPAVLTLDDLQWCDASTAELLAFLGRRTEPARLLIVGAYRSAELPKAHPFARAVGELITHKQASTITLEALSQATLAEYLAARFADHAFPRDFEATLFQLTGGNPLFVTTLLDDLQSRGLIGATSGRWQLQTTLEDVAARRPDGIRRLIDIQIDRLGVPEQRILEAASVVGETFASGVVAHCLGSDADDVDARCESLANQHRFLRYVDMQTWPDGTIQTRYDFAHALYRHAAFARTPSASVRTFHRAAAQRLRTGHAGSEDAIAAELAGHFDEGKVPAEAVHCYALAGGRAARLHGHVEAIAHFERGRALLPSLPGSPERNALELRILDGLGPSLFWARGADAPDLVPALERAAELARALGDDIRLYRALFELQRFRMLRGQLREIGEHGEEIRLVAARLPDPALGVGAAFLKASAAVFRGRFAEAEEEFARVPVPADAPCNELPTVPIGRAHMAVLAWATGRPDTALALARRAVSSAEASRDPFVLVHTLGCLSFLHAWRREPGATLEVARRTHGLLAESPVPFWNDRARLLLAWACSELDATTLETHVQELLAQPLDLGGVRRTVEAPLFVELLARANRTDRALDEIAGALAHARKTDERIGEPELLRLRGELLEARDPDEAGRCLEGAFELAKEQRSAPYELRAALSLCRYRRGAKKRQAMAELRRIVSTFAEGSETADLRSAKALLTE